MPVSLNLLNTSTKCDVWMTSHYLYTQSLLQCRSNAGIHCIKYINKIPMDCWPVISVEGSRGRTATVENPKITHVKSFFSKTSCHTQTNNNIHQIISPYINPQVTVLLSAWQLISYSLLAALRAAQACRYLIYSEADFEVFHPAGTTHCTDGGETWHGGGDLLHAKSFLYSNAFMAKSAAQTLTLKSVTDRQTKNSTFLATLAAGEIRAPPNLAWW